MLPTPKSGTINTIIHISDIHIRNGDANKSRYSEYLTVINETSSMIKSIQDVKNNKAIIIITGDIFDIKNKLESCAIKVFYVMLKTLSDICPLYIIQGNHDYRQDQQDTPDILSSLLHMNDNPNIVYIKETGTYHAGNVGFGIVSVKDTLRTGSTSGKVDVLPPFPKTFPNHVTTKIALFHGDIKNSTLQNYRPHQGGYPIEWFDGYDLGLFGDIHLQQVHGAKSIHYNEHTGQETFEVNKGTLAWGYPGSLVQCNWGEPLIGHGFLTWDLDKKTVTTNHVYNEYGMMYLKQDKDEWLMSHNNRWVQFVPQTQIIPSNLLLRFKGKTTPEGVDKLKHIMADSKRTKKYTILSDILNSGDDESVDPEYILSGDTIEAKTIASFNSPEVWIKYIQDNKYDQKILNDINWTSWLSDPKSLTIPQEYTIESLKPRVDEKNKEIIKIGGILQENVSEHIIKQHKSPLCLKYITWKWLLCYKDENFFDFNSMENKVCTINAPNDAGKSSFLEIICLSLFGDQIPSRYNTTHTASIICYQKPDGQSSSTSITFTIGQNMYKIDRSFEKNIKTVGKPATLKSRDRDVTLQKIVQGQNSEIHKGSTAVREWINENIGSIESFLLSCMITQKDDMELMFLDESEQIKLLDRAINLECVRSLKEYLRKASNAYNDIIKGSEDIYSHCLKDTTYIGANIEELEQKKQHHSMMVEQLSMEEKQFDQITETWHNLDQIEFNQPIETVKEKLDILTKKHNSLTSCIPTDIQDVEKLTEQKIKHMSEIINLDSTYCSDNEIDFSSIEKYQSDLNILLSNEVKQPLVNQEYINHQVIQIEKTKTLLKLSTIDLNNMVKSNADSLPNIKLLEAQNILLNNDLDNITKDLKIHKNSQPNKVLNYNETTTMEEIKKHKFRLIILDGKYGSSDELKKYCKTNQVNKPLYDIPTLDKMTQSLNRNIMSIDQVSYKSWEKLTDNELDILFDEYTEKYDSIDVELQETQTEIANYEDKQMNQSKTIKSIREKLDQLRKTILQPNETLTSINEWKTEWKKLSDCFQQKYDAQQNALAMLEKTKNYDISINILNNKIDIVQSRIDTINSQNHPFNPNCWACVKQTWKTDIEQCRSECSIMKDQLKLLIEEKTTLNVDKWQTEKNNTDSWLVTYDAYKNQLLYWTKQEQLTSDYKQVTSTENILTHETHVYDTIDKQLKLLKEQQDTLKREIEPISQTKHQLKQYIDNYTSWKQQEALISTQKTINSTYEQIFQAHKHLDEYLTILSEIEKLTNDTHSQKIYHAWETVKNNMEQTIEYKNAQIQKNTETIDNTNRIINLIQDVEKINKDKQSLEIYQQWINKCNKLKKIIHIINLQEVTDQLEKIKTMTDLNTQIKMLVSVLHCKPLYDKKLALKTTIALLRNDITQSAIAINQLQLQVQKQQKYQTDIKQYEQNINALKNIKNAINYIESAFNGYHFYLYKQIVIPKIAEEVNRRVHCVTETTKYKLIIDVDEVTERNHTKIKLSWYIHDGNNKVIIQKSGGFRTFIFGLITRISMAYLGTSSTSCRQLFIDEGFLSADSNNIEKMPDFIKSLTRMYDSALIVSHCDSIKESADIFAYIQKDDKSLSRLQFGQKNNVSVKVAQQLPIIKPTQTHQLPVNNPTQTTKKLQIKLKPTQ